MEAKKERNGAKESCCVRRKPFEPSGRLFDTKLGTSMPGFLEGKRRVDHRTTLKMRFRIFKPKVLSVGNNVLSTAHYQYMVPVTATRCGVDMRWKSSQRPRLKIPVGTTPSANIQRCGNSNFIYRPKPSTCSPRETIYFSRTQGNNLGQKFQRLNHPREYPSPPGVLSLVMGSHFPP